MQPFFDEANIEEKNKIDNTQRQKIDVAETDGNGMSNAPESRQRHAKE